MTEEAKASSAAPPGPPSAPVQSFYILMKKRCLSIDKMLSADAKREEKMEDMQKENKALREEMQKIKNDLRDKEEKVREKYN
jgi:cell division protein FtsB